ncbi:MAG: YceI family protein [Polyangiaceae bacterium]|nr:YceI family protein [Polyangiaceae bacterium]
MKTTRDLVLGVGLLMLAGCQDPAKDKPMASVGSAVPAATASASPSAPAAGSEKLGFSQATSKVEFVGAKITGKHQGKFKTFSGTVELVGGRLEGGKVRVEIELASVETDAEKLTGHLKTGDFFDVEKHPKAVFESTSVTPGGQGGTHTVTGNLELRGTKKSVSFPATLALSDGELTVKAEFGINRKDFGLVYPGKPDDLIADNVVIRLDIQAPRKK